MKARKRRRKGDLTSPESMDSLAAVLDTGKEDQAECLPGRIARYARAKERALAMQKYLEESGWLMIEGTGRIDAGGVDRRNQGRRAVLAALKLEQCGNYLHFRHYFTVNRVLLHAACFCKQHLICPLCAIRRGSKTLEAYLARFRVIHEERPQLKPYLMTFTVRDGADLKERTSHLLRAFQTLKDRRRNFQAGVRGAPWTEFAKVAGAVGSYEFKRGDGSGLWHPHIHMVAMCASPPDQGDLRREWEAITGDSFMVDVRPFHEGQDPAQGFMEVFKYAVKFGDLSLADNWEVAEYLRGSRLLFSLGVFRGVQVPDELTDEPLDGLPYFDMFYSYFVGSGYSIDDPYPHLSDYPVLRRYGRYSCGAPS